MPVTAAAAAAAAAVSVTFLHGDNGNPIVCACWFSWTTPCAAAENISDLWGLNPAWAAGQSRAAPMQYNY
jgi:hypothetical protein